MIEFIATEWLWDLSDASDVRACACVTEREILCLYLYDVQQSEQSDAQKVP